MIYFSWVDSKPAIFRRSALQKVRIETHLQWCWGWHSGGACCPAPTEGCRSSWKSPPCSCTLHSHRQFRRRTHHNLETTHNISEYAHRSDAPHFNLRRPARRGGRKAEQCILGNSIFISTAKDLTAGLLHTGRDTSGPRPDCGILISCSALVWEEQQWL